MADETGEGADARASTLAADPGRSPSQQRLHDDVRGALFEGRPTASGSGHEPGAVLGSRYRVVGLVGRGGMGEVYRARDLVIDEDVAIKFLPPQLADRPAYLDRFVQEVRMARQVSHPNVCRVHDLGEADGRRFISMEYIDGEDLASLLKRIGRFGPEKGLELAHQLCSGLAALHERGIVHRDLKPSNVMVDGEGHIRIADFGLASAVAELGDHEIRDGTPAYQAPEQTAGKEVTVRSDIYALGLVLYEMFHGHRRDDQDTKTSSTRTAPVDPEITEVIDRCLARDPAQRPESAVAVSATLPGGDPLAAALAAGRMPSPEAVANAATVGGLQPRIAIALVVLTAVAMFFVAGMGTGTTALAHSKLMAPDVLRHRVGEILQVAGYNPDFNGADAVALDYDHPLINALVDAEDDPGRALRESGDSAFRMTYRGFPVLRSTESTISAADLPLTEPLQTEVVVDGQGRLRSLTRIPQTDIYADEGSSTGGETEPEAPVGPIQKRGRLNPEDRPLETPLRTMAWGPLLKEAGFEDQDLTPIAATARPPVFADSVSAWKTTLGDHDATITAAALRGRPVWFDIQREFAETASEKPNLAFVATFIVFLLMMLVVLLATFRHAIATLRRREGDFVGARRIAYVVFCGIVTGWLLTQQAFELLDVLPWTILAAGAAVSSWLGYLILEPYARQHWPRTLVAWSRVLQGRFRDPMVGRDLLVGTATATVLAAMYPMMAAFIADNDVSTNPELSALLGVRHTLGRVIDDALDAILTSLGAYVVLLGLQSLLRIRALAVLAFVGLLPVAMYASTGEAWVALATAITLAAGMVVALRFGLLALVTLNVVLAVVIHLPITYDLTRWYGSTGLFGIALVATVTAIAYWLATTPYRAAASLRSRTAAAGTS